MRVLALVPGGIEEQLFFFPTLKRLREAFPKAEISVVADPQAKDAYRLSKASIDVIPYNFQARNSPADWANLLGVMRDREFEAVLTCTTSWSIGLLLWLSGIPTRIGYSSPANQAFLTQTVPAKADQWTGDRFYDLLQGLDVQGACPDLSLNVPQKDISAVDALRQTAGLDGQGYVLVYPGCLNTGERYPTMAWGAILQDFQNRQPDLPIVLVQTAETAEQTAALLQMRPSLKAIAPENGGQMAALVAGANLLVSVDAYPLYLAAALGVYAVGLFGATAPEQKLPPRKDETKVLSLRADSGSLEDIQPALVLKKIWNE